MAYRGWLALNGTEIANSARTIAHLGAETPTTDFGFFTDEDGSYALEEIPDSDGLYYPDASLGTYVEGVGWMPGELVAHPEEGQLYLTAWSPCAPIESVEYPGFLILTEDQIEVSEGLWTPPAHARIYTEGIFVHDECWDSPSICSSCSSLVSYDDSWPDQKVWLDDSDYRPELAPWYTALLPE